MKKRILSLLVALTICVGLAVPALAAETYEIEDTYYPAYGHKAREEFVSISAESVEKGAKASLGNFTSETMENFSRDVDTYYATGACRLCISGLIPYNYIFVYYSASWNELRADNREILEPRSNSYTELVYDLSKTGVYAIEMMFFEIPVKCVFAVEVSNDGGQTLAPEPTETPSEPAVPIGTTVTLPRISMYPNTTVMLGRVLNIHSIPVQTEEWIDGKLVNVVKTITVYQLPLTGSLLGAIMGKNEWLYPGDYGCYSLANGKFVSNGELEWFGQQATMHGPGTDEYSMDRSERMEGHEITNIYGLRLAEDLVIYYTYADLSAYDKSAVAAPKFTDVSDGAYYAEPVAWAVANGITNGTTETTFSPSNTCTNAQILTFMWRAAGSPEPTVKNPFTNLTGKEYYAKAAVWAYEKGMISGTTFDGNKPCTRSMTMEYFWKQAGSPKTAVSNKFTDVNVNASYAQAVAWAVANGVTTGTSDTTFTPDSTCTRGQIVTFLYRALN